MSRIARLASILLIVITALVACTAPEGGGASGAPDPAAAPSDVPASAAPSGAPAAPGYDYGY
jgi:hypothetical protein